MLNAALIMMHQSTKIKKGTGTRYAYKTRMLGIKFPVETEIHDYVEDQGWNGISTRGVPHRTMWSFEASGKETRFTYGLEGRMPIPLFGPLIDSRILHPLWEKIISNSLQNLKTKIESDENGMPIH